ncbi:MAG: protein translocase subunit SecF [Methanomicrobiales archaeon]|nr:protein translocase subunit SecF [Methanomicrobiales archaeon]
MQLPAYDVNRYTPKQMVIIPLILLVLALISLAITMASTGLPVRPGIDFTGGETVTITTTETTEQIFAVFSGYPLETVRDVTNGKYLEFRAMDDTTALNALIDTRYPDSNIFHIGASFGKNLQGLALEALLLSFIGMTVVVFITFRSFVPSAAVVLSAFADIAMTAAAMNVLGLPLTLGTTAALLMLIGYSVDSDILLTMRTIKRQGKLEDKLAGAFHTGIIMTSTAIAAAAAMWVVSWYGNILIINEISTVLLLGLAFDIMNTWLTNAAIIKWYLGGRGESKQDVPKKGATKQNASRTGGTK